MWTPGATYESCAWRLMESTCPVAEAVGCGKQSPPSRAIRIYFLIFYRSSAQAHRGKDVLSCHLIMHA
jgi:hypothetical protein